MMNDELTGTDGYEVYQQGNGGEQIPGTMTDSEAAVDGSDVTLTIDQDVNWYVKKVLREGKEEFGAAWAIGVVQDLQTNEIIALEDTDEIEAGSDDAKLNVSQAVSETFEPGSIGKVITMAGLLQTGLHKATDQFTVPYSMTKNGQEFHDPTNHGSEHWTLAGILQNSSNVGMVMAAELSHRLGLVDAAFVQRLRAPDGCPWDREQDHLSLRKFLLEETYEVYDALDQGSSPKLAEELGDALPVSWVHRDERYVEKLSTPDTSVAGMPKAMDATVVCRSSPDWKASMRPSSSDRCAMMRISICE